MTGVVKNKKSSAQTSHTVDELQNINLNLTGFQKLVLLVQQAQVKRL